MSFNAAQIAVEIRSLIDGQTGYDIFELMDKVANKHPGVTHGVLLRAVDIVSDQLREEVATAQKEAASMHRLRPLFEDAPEGATLGEVARVKADAGDPLAQEFLDWLDSPQSRLGSALFCAACDSDPRWVKKDGRSYAWRGEGKPPNPNAVIDAFQLTHPEEARRIEDEIMRGTEA